MAVDGLQENGGYERSRFNATRHGLTSRHMLLPWEDPDEFATLREALIDEHQPKGPTEQHLVDELAALGASNVCYRPSAPRSATS